MVRRREYNRRSYEQGVGLMQTYSQEQREYWVKRPVEIKYETVDFYHPDQGNMRLVGNQFFDKILNGDNYQAVAMQLPQVTNQSTDTTDAGAIQFGRIGTNVREWLSGITPVGAIKHPITATLRQFKEGIEPPIYERRLYVDGKGGIRISTDAVTIKLSVENPSKLTNKTAFYDPAIYKGLQDL